jgi:hypothetical protein
MNANLNIESIFLGLLIAGVPLVVTTFMQRRAAISSTLLLRERIENLQRYLATMAGAHAEAMDEARRELSVVVHPFENVEGDDGWVVDDRIAEIGYQYQLFIKGIPCFAPHTVITKRVHKKEVNPEKLAAFRKDVESLLNTVASQHPAFSFSSKVKNLL